MTRQRLQILKVLGAALLAGASAAAVAAERIPAADFLIQGGTVHRGDDSEPGIADVVIRGDRIVYVGHNAAGLYAAREVIDARGRIVAPGFIDPHTHPDEYLLSPDPARRLNAPWLFQGATTLLVGVDGSGTPDVAQEREAYERAGIGTNVAMYIGFGAVRMRVLGEAARAPDSAELEEMRKLVAGGMCEGAIGLSSGLFYPPQGFATTAEVIALASEAARHGGLYDTHQRDESSYSIGLLASVQEALQIGREAGLPVHIAHIKALGVDVHGQAPQVIALIEAARMAGQRVSADQYPWAASGTSLEAALLPQWSVDGGRIALLARLAQPPELARIRTAMGDNLRRRGGAESLLLTGAGTPWTGKTLAQVAHTVKLEPVDAALRLITDGSVDTSIASFNMLESDIRQFMRQPWVVTSSDGSDGHPRQYATFPMKYARYVRQEKVLGLHEFIRSSTGRTADIFRLDGRGYLKAGHFADVVVFDPVKFAPRADYLHPRELSAGVETLFVNGRAAIRSGTLTGEAGGRFLAHQPAAGSCAGHRENSRDP